MEDINLQLSNDQLQKIQKKLKIKNAVSNKHLVKLAVAEFLKKELIQ